MTLDGVTFVLTGDAEEKVWTNIAGSIPRNTSVFKVPHHGSKNGFFDRNNNALWLNHCPVETLFGVSSHIRPFSHPDPEVVAELPRESVYRTDEHYHVTFTTDGSTVGVKYSHF